MECGIHWFFHLTNADLDLTVALTSPDSEPWFPLIVGSLVNDAESKLLSPVGLKLETYGTNRFLERSLSRNFEFVENIGPNATNLPVVEYLACGSRLPFEKAGLCFCSPEDVSKSTLKTLNEAFSTLKIVPSLLSSVSQLVRVIHILRTHDASYDVSHSDPSLPFSIFLSVPEGNGDEIVLRALESLVHEAMHLQLTMIENNVPIILDCKSQIYSPWRREPRPVRGVFHGVYVFTNVCQAYQLLKQSALLSYSAREYVDKRISIIERELCEANEGFPVSSLTPIGKQFYQNLLRH